MELKINAAKTRAVTARSLSRDTADLLNEIEEEGIGLTIVRYGRPVALLVPLERPVRRAPRRVAVAPAESNGAGTSADDPDVSELDEYRRFLLLESARVAPAPYDPEDWPHDIQSFVTSRVRLEMDGFVERAGGGRHWLTAKGERAAAVLGTAAES